MDEVQQITINLLFVFFCFLYIWLQLKQMWFCWNDGDLILWFSEALNLAGGEEWGEVCLELC